MDDKPSIVCFGEIYWEVLPTTKIARGLLIEAASYSQRIGVDIHLISAVGNDELGKKLLQLLQQEGLPIDLIHTNYTFNTGTSNVVIDKKGKVNYEIAKPAAWDFLFVENKHETIVENADFLLFSNLVTTRYNNNYECLQYLITKAKKIVFDVNIHIPISNRVRLENLIHKAHILKITDEGLDRISGWYVAERNLLKQMKFVKDKYDLESLIVTNTNQGVCCLYDNVLITKKDNLIKVGYAFEHSVAFLISLLHKMKNGFDQQEDLESNFKVTPLSKPHYSLL